MRLRIWSQVGAIDFLKSEFFSWLRPPKKLSLSEWSDENAYLSAESSAEAGRWHTIPYQRGIMDAITEPHLEQVSVIKSARVGYTKILNNTIGYYIHQDPCPMMLVQPTIEDAQGYSKEEIAPMLRDTPCLRGLVTDAKEKTSDNTILAKNYPGGTLGLVGANSGRGFRRVSRRVVLFDEVDAYPDGGAGKDGDQIKLGIKRTEYYWNRKIIAGSTPLVKDHSRIEKLFLSGDQRRYFVPCPQCHAPQYLKFKNMHWPKGKPEEAYFKCEVNACVIEHKDKRWMVEMGDLWSREKPGQGYGWQATAPFDGKHASFHIWAAYSYSPNATWAHIAKEHVESVQDPELLKTFVNTWLGESWEENYSAKVGASELQARAELYLSGTSPAQGLVLVAGVDVQDNRFAITRTAFGKGEEQFIVDHQEIMGDPSQPAIWKQLVELLKSPVNHELGGQLVVKAAAIDSGGHFTHEVYQFVRDIGRQQNWIAVRGASQRGKPAIGKPSTVDLNYKGQVLKNGAQVYVVGSDTIKTTIFARLKHNEPGPGYIHFPQDLDAAYYEQLTAEKQTTRYSKGQPIREWVKKSGARNEALDCAVYGYAALQFYMTKFHHKTFWEQMEKALPKKDETGPNQDKNGQNKTNQAKIGQNRRNFVTNF